MRFTTGLLAVASLAVGAPVQEESPLSVKLQMSGNSAVKATITNAGKQNLKLLKAGSILDNIATEKAAVLGNDEAIQFEGVRARVKLTSLEESAFQHIATGESIDVTFDLAETHNLSAGGKLSIVSSGILRYAEEGSTNLVGSINFQSNQVDTEVDGAMAQARRSDLLETRKAKRSIIANDCKGDQLTAIEDGLSGCQSLAKAGKRAANSASAASMKNFFKSASQDTRDKVSEIFSASDTECGATQNAATVYCTDIHDECSSDYLAFTYPSLNQMVYCPGYFDLPETNADCYAQSQDNTVLHESTHLRQVAGTDDHAYGYDAVVKLSAQQALDNADTFAIFAQAASQNCL